MSRRPTRQITWPFILRTFKRVDMIARRYTAESIAKGLVERDVDLDLGAEYLIEISDRMRAIRLKAGTLHAHPGGDPNCLECGKPVQCARNGARYCSRECRQRAYRVRKAVAEGRNSPIPKRAQAMVTEIVKVGGRPLVLHLKKRRNTKKRSVELQSDTSTRTESETNVAQADETGSSARDFVRKLLISC